MSDDTESEIYACFFCGDRFRPKIGAPLFICKDCSDGAWNAADKKTLRWVLSNLELSAEAMLSGPRRFDVTALREFISEQVIGRVRVAASASLHSASGEATGPRGTGVVDPCEAKVGDAPRPGGPAATPPASASPGTVALFTFPEPERDLTLAEISVWGECKTCGAKHGQRCAWTAGKPDHPGSPPAGPHMSRLRETPMRVRLVRV